MIKLIREWEPHRPKCPEVKFPLNMYDARDITRPSVDFCATIRNIFNVFQNQGVSTTVAQYSFIWVETIKYCGAEYALYEYLHSENEANFKTYYFSLPQNDYFELEEILEVLDDESGSYITEGTEAKIFVLDHAENIDNPKKLIDFSQALYKNDVSQAIFIFIDERSNFENNFWQKVRDLSGSTEQYLTALRRGKHFRVEPFSNNHLEKIFNGIESLEDSKKQELLKRARGFDDHLRRAYFLDRFIEYILHKDNPIPHDFKSFNLLLAIYENILLDIYTNKVASASFPTLDTRSYSIFKNYIEACNSKITSINDNPIKQFVWAYGFSQLIKNNGCDNIKPLFEYIFNEFRTGYDDEQSVFEETFELILPDKRAMDLLLELSNYNLWGAVYSLRIIYKFQSRIVELSLDIRNIFLQACKKYSSDVMVCPNYENCVRGEESDNCKGEIKSRYALGMAIGVLLPNIDNNVISKGLNHIFREVKDDYVLPQVDNYSGISVCPITNFEYKKFVDDKGYKTLEMPDVANVRNVYYGLYAKLIGILAEAAKSDNQRLRRRVAKALRGSTWVHYNLLSYILREMRETDDNGEIISLKRVLEEYYSETILAPVKWKTPYNVMENFCNPLQPVVGISLFEAEAYAKWLSKKSGKNVRLVKFNPDYLKVIGDSSQKTVLPELKNISEKFNKFKSPELLKLINIRENTRCYYGPTNTGDQGPATVGLLPQYKCSDGILDFLGNVYEMQSTMFGNDEIANPNVPDWQKIYNCSGGGWQHASDHLPVDYMGQFTALTRNQDIGFRVVVDSDDVELEYHTPIEDENFEEEYNINTQGIAYQESQYSRYNDDSTVKGQIDLDKFNVRLHGSREVIASSKTFKTKKAQQTAVKFYSIQELYSFPEQAIMLYADGFDIFAYCLEKIASAKLNDDIVDGDYIDICSRVPLLPQNSNDYKNLSNRERAAKIDMIEIVIDGAKAYYSAKAIDIACGRFKINDIKKGSTDDRDLLGLWDIVCDFDYESTLINETIKWKIKADFFMPDWIDLFDIINLSNDESDDTGDKIDTDTTMTVLSTIDTADLHKLIDMKN